MLAGLLLLALASAPEPPRSRVDTADPVGGVTRTIRVTPGSGLQQALDLARPGDELVLDAGAVYRGPFLLPRKAGNGWIVVRTSAQAELPLGTRVDPADAGKMPKLESREGAVVRAAPGAGRYRFVGVEIRPAPGVFLEDLVVLGPREHHLVFERCYVHGDPQLGSRRGVSILSRETAVVDSWLSDLKEEGAAAQAIAVGSGAGPVLIENNRIEAAGTNVRVEGQDVELLRNQVSKPLRWKSGEPGHRGASWLARNLLEVADARRVRIAGNVFEQNWGDAEGGFALVFGGAQDVSVESNVVRRTASGISVAGERLAIRNNLLESVGEARWGKGGRLFRIARSAADLVIEHNTALHRGAILDLDGPAGAGLVFRDNIVAHDPESAAGGTGSWSEFRRNAIVGGRPASYPHDNLFPLRLEAVGFADAENGDFRLQASSPLRRAASDGRDVGVNVETLEQALTATSAPALDAPAPTATLVTSVAKATPWWAGN